MKKLLILFLLLMIGSTSFAEQRTISRPGMIFINSYPAINTVFYSDEELNHFFLPQVVSLLNHARPTVEARLKKLGLDWFSGKDPSGEKADMVKTAKLILMHEKLINELNFTISDSRYDFIIYVSDKDSKVITIHESIWDRQEKKEIKENKRSEQ